MATFDIHQHGDDYLLNVQPDLLNGLNTAVMVPLLALKRAPEPMGRLNPILEIDGQRYSMVTQYMAATPLKRLGPVAGNLMMTHHDQIRSALDMVFLGF